MISAKKLQQLLQSEEYFIEEENDRLWDEENPSKLHNIKVEIDGHKFDSKKEADYYLILRDMQERGEIDDLKLQPEFVLLDKFKAIGKTFRAVKYRADFSYIEADGHYVVVDTKGYATAEFIIKEKMFRVKWPGIDFRVIK